MTTQDVQQIEEQARRAGADLCLAKPIERERLLELLADLWQTMQVAMPPPTASDVRSATS